MHQDTTTQGIESIVSRDRQMPSHHISVKQLWQKVEGMTQCNITYHEVICGFGENLFANYVANITAYIVYKDWLIHSLENKKRIPQINLTYLKKFFHRYSFTVQFVAAAYLRTKSKIVLKEASICRCVL